MAIETISVCPLGSQCETVKDNKIHRCAWFTELAGENPQTGELMNEWRCAMAWIPIMLVENSNTNRGQTAALESFRNETVNGQAVFNGIMAAAIEQKRINNG